MINIKIPLQLSPEELFPFSVELAATPEDDEYILDFNYLGLVEPFGMLFLAAIIRQFMRARKIQQGKEFSVKAINFSDKKYASVMGLFKSFGLDFGKNPGEALGSMSYIPITRLTVSKITGQARDEYTHHGEVIEIEAGRIASILSRGDGSAIAETLTYAIREIMRNVVEHGDATHIWYAAQYWPTKNKVEVSILDEGVGLISSLRRNPKIKVESNQDAILMALRPGISGVAKNKRKRSDGDWVNSGYGLFMTSSLCREAGEFIICTGADALKLDSSESKFITCAFKGVAIKMVLDTTKIRSLDLTLAELKNCGERIAREIGNTDTELTASKISNMLLKKNDRK